MNHEIVKPTLVLDTDRARRNIHRMAEKARRQGVRLRPHFKTHQSIAIGEWFRQAGVTAITVSSQDMAEYFAGAGWEDITIAFPLNPRQIGAMSALGRSIRLGVLVESVESFAHSHGSLAAPLEVWIEVDEGSGRSGVAWNRENDLLEVAHTLKGIVPLQLKGLLTHSGRVYQAASPTEICRIYRETVERLQYACQLLATRGFTGLEISVGDTPGCTLVDDFGAVDEIRPGNFVFYDVQQLQMGVCRFEEIALAVACPVVARHPERQEVVIYGGAIHLSKDTVTWEGQRTYGLVALATSQGWSNPLAGAFVARLSQEHGVVHLPAGYFSQVQVGDLLYILPAHACLAVSALREYHTLAGEKLAAMP